MINLIKKILLNLYLWPMFFVATIISLIFFPFFVLFFIIIGKRKDSAIRLSISVYGWILVKVLPFFAPVKVYYKGKKFPKPCIFVANHCSSIDPYLFGALMIDGAFISTWPFKIPVYGFFMKIAQYINATEGWDSILQQGKDLLNKGANLIIWPEGHRSRTGKLGVFKKGAFAISVETGYPIVPVCIIGSGKLMPPGKLLLTPSRIKLIVLDPIYPEPDDDKQMAVKKLRKKVFDVLKEALENYNLNESNN
ncbi:MAG: lysophospholipid acyltransferase family protein [Brevinematales bacterium]